MYGIDSFEICDEYERATKTVDDFLDSLNTQDRRWLLNKYHETHRTISRIAARQLAARKMFLEVFENMSAKKGQVKNKKSIFM